MTGPHAATVPQGIDLHPANEFKVTSSYRNPYSNANAGSSSAKSRHCWSGAMGLVDKNGEGYTDELKSLWTTCNSTTGINGMFVECSQSNVEDAIFDYLEKELEGNLSSSVVPGSVSLKSMPDGVRSSYIIVWSKRGWKEATFDWIEETAGGQVLHENDTYILGVSDWSNVGRNLHTEDKASAWGF